MNKEKYFTVGELIKIIISLCFILAGLGLMGFISWQLFQMGSISEIKRFLDSLSGLEQTILVFVGIASPFLCYHFFRKICR